MFIRIFLLVSLIGCVNRVLALPPVVSLTDAQSRYSVGTSAEYLEDPAGTLPFSTVRADGRFRRSRQPTPSFGFSESVYWFRFRLRNEATDPEWRWLLELGYSHFKTMDLYVLDAGGRLVNQISAGNSRGAGHRPLATHHYVFPLRLAPGQQATVYLRCDALASKLFPLTIYEQHSFYDYAQNTSLWLGFYFGFIAITILYHFLLFLYNRIPSYLLFSLYLTAYLLSELLRGNGNYIERFFLVYHPFWQQHVVALLNGVIVLVMLLWLRFYAVGLQLEKASWMHGLMRKLPLVNLVLYGVLLTGWFPVSYSLGFNFAAPILAFLAVLVVSLIRIVEGFRIAWYYFAGSLILSGGVVVVLLNRSGALPGTTFWLHNAIQVASILEIILLSLGFAESIRAERRRKKQELDYSNLVGRKSEREWLSVVLHTSFGTTISSMIFQLSQVEWRQLSTANQHILTALRLQLSESLGELRILARSLPPTLLDEQGLQAALSALLTNFNSRKLTRFHLLTSGEEQRLEPRHEFEVYLIGLELVNNVMRHANATTAWLELIWEQHNRLTIRMRDNGRGFGDDEPGGGYGLDSIRRIVRQNLNGSVDVANAPGEGAVVTVRVSFEQQAVLRQRRVRYTLIRRLFAGVRSYF